MYIRNKVAAIIYHAVVGILALIGWLAALNAFEAAWSNFVTWVLMATAIYYLATAIVELVFSRFPVGKMLCPLLQGAILIALWTSGLTAMVCLFQSIAHPYLNGAAGALIYASLPVLALGDWFLFAKKGQWSVKAPWYWLAAPMAYSAIVLIAEGTVGMTPPLPFLNVNTILLEMDLFFCWLAVYGILGLTAGYTLVALDALMSGKLSKHIVLPHIVVIENPKNQSK